MPDWKMGLHTESTGTRQRVKAQTAAEFRKWNTSQELHCLPWSTPDDTGTEAGKIRYTGRELPWLCLDTIHPRACYVFPQKGGAMP